MRERQVLRLMALGYGNRPIAMMLGVAPSTATTHTKNILHKLGAKNRAQACYVAYQRGLLAFDGEDIRVC